MALCCAICYEREGDNAVWVETGWDAAFVGVCPRCIAKIELERERLARVVPYQSECTEYAIACAKRAMGRDSFLDKLPTVPERGFVGLALEHHHV